MQIQKNSTTNINFKATPLYKVKLKNLQNGLNEFLDASFSELSQQTIKDLKLVKALSAKWKTAQNVDNYTSTIAGHFHNQENEPYRKFFIVELKNKCLTQFVKTQSIIETTNPDLMNKSEFAISYLQSASATLNPPKVKGAGELAMYGAVKVARDSGFEKVTVYSTNDGFYKKIKFGTSEPELPIGSMFTLWRKDFNKFLKKVEKKYNFKG